MNLAHWYESPKKNRIYIHAIYKDMLRWLVKKNHYGSMVEAAQDAIRILYVMKGGKGKLEPMDYGIRKQRAKERREREDA